MTMKNNPRISKTNTSVLPWNLIITGTRPYNGLAIISQILFEKFP